jgi:hypothetical protein
MSWVRDEHQIRFQCSEVNARSYGTADKAEEGMALKIRTGEQVLPHALFSVRLILHHGNRDAYRLYRKIEHDQQI